MTEPLAPPPVPIRSWWYRFCLHIYPHWREALKNKSPFPRVMIQPWVGFHGWQDLHKSIYGRWCLENLAVNSFVYLVQDQNWKQVNIHGPNLCEGSLVGIMFENELDAMQFKLTFSEKVMAEEYTLK